MHRKLHNLLIERMIIGKDLQVCAFSHEHRRRRLGRRAIAVPTDVTDDAAVARLAERAVSEFGALDIWVNNAGGSPVRAALTEITREAWDAAIAVNLTSVWVCSVAAVRHMRDGGRIVNISSLAGDGPMPGSGHYGAAKAGVNNLTVTMAAELGPRGVRVNGIARHDG